MEYFPCRKLFCLHHVLLKEKVRFKYSTQRTLGSNFVTRLSEILIFRGQWLRQEMTIEVSIKKAVLIYFSKFT